MAQTQPGRRSMAPSETPSLLNALIHESGSPLRTLRRHFEFSAIRGSGASVLRDIQCDLIDSNNSSGAAMGGLLSCLDSPSYQSEYSAYSANYGRPRASSHNATRPAARTTYNYGGSSVGYGGEYASSGGGVSRTATVSQGIPARTAPGTGPGGLPAYTLAQVSQHNTQQDAWMVIGGQVRGWIVVTAAVLSSPPVAGPLSGMNPQFIHFYMHYV